MKHRKTFVQAIQEAISVAMSQDPSVICYGLGVTDPKGVFGTTLGLQERFGKDRVFDMPLSENAMTGIAIGASLNGIRPVMVHQRMDFFLLAMDQLVNNAAKWFYMFGGKSPVPITIRLITGMGWGQGPTHSQSFQSWFAHIPGLKVVMPTFASDAKGLLLSSIFDDNPVLFIEHRWLHQSEAEVEEGDVRIPLGKANLLQEGKDLTIVAYSFMTMEALRAMEQLTKAGISCDLIDLRTIKPLDWDCILSSIRKTGRLLALDSSHGTCSIASDIISHVCCEAFTHLTAPPVKLALPDIPLPTSPALTKQYYHRAREIAAAAGALVGRPCRWQDTEDSRIPHDVPGDWFKGPF